jgi:hypothetical protein
VKALKGSRMGLGLLGIVGKEWDNKSNQTNPISSASSFFLKKKIKKIKKKYIIIIIIIFIFIIIIF